MPFDSKPRVKFNNDPLVEVVCQIVFVSRIKEMDTPNKLIQLHDSIKNLLPLFRKAKSVSLDVNTDTQKVSHTETVVYEFLTIDESVRVSISPDNMSFVTNRYESKENFFNYIDAVYKALDVIFEIPLIKRVGLRYQDVIQRSRLGEGFFDMPWNELLRGSLISIFEEDEIAKTTLLGAQSNFVIALGSISKDAKMNVKCSIVYHAETKEACFMIDSDYYTEEILAYDAALSFLHDANVKARDFFQWCIKPKLYDALLPEQIQQ